MAIFIAGAACLICKRPVESGEEILFPPFTPNTADPIYEFSDGVAHAMCFQASEKKRWC